MKLPDSIPSTVTKPRRPVICVFCGSSPGGDPAYAEAARKLGTMIAKTGMEMVFGGGAVGLMGETARAARNGGRTVTGILPEFLRHLEPPLTNGETVEITADLQERKRRMLALADAFVILPGGFGTLDEFFEVLTSAQLRVLDKPIIVVDTNGFYAPLKALLAHVVKAGFAKTENLALVHFAATPEDAIAQIRGKHG